MNKLLLLTPSFQSMNYHPYIITYIEHIPGETFLMRVKPQNESAIFSFIAGQYSTIKNPNCDKPNEPHTFSIASSPHTTQYLEFCIKQYGNWTRTLAKANVGDVVELSPPEGNFTWNNSYKNVVFMAGGLGISPIMSMLRTIQYEQQTPSITLLYGNRNTETISYNVELAEMAKDMNDMKVVHILSHLLPKDLWQGYRGFITDEIVKNEVDLQKNPLFFIIGPPIFIEKMIELLSSLGVAKENLIVETL